MQIGALSLEGLRVWGERIEDPGVWYVQVWKNRVGTVWLSIRLSNYFLFIFVIVYTLRTNIHILDLFDFCWFLYVVFRFLNTDILFWHLHQLKDRRRGRRSLCSATRWGTDKPSTGRSLHHHKRGKRWFKCWKARVFSGGLMFYIMNYVRQLINYSSLAKDVVISAYFKFFNWLVKHAAWMKHLNHRSFIKKNDRAVMRTHLGDRNYYMRVLPTVIFGDDSGTREGLVPRRLLAVSWAREASRCKAGHSRACGPTKGYASLHSVWMPKDFCLVIREIPELKQTSFGISWTWRYPASKRAINPLTLEFFLILTTKKPDASDDNNPRFSVTVGGVGAAVGTVPQLLAANFQVSTAVFVFFHYLYLSFVYISILPIFYPFTTSIAWYNKK